MFRLACFAACLGAVLLLASQRNSNALFTQPVGMYVQSAVQSYGNQVFMSAAPPPAFALSGLPTAGMVDFQAPMPVQVSNLDQIGQTLAGVVAVDGGTTGLEVQFGAFLAVILGLFIPVVFLITVYIQSEAQGTATSFRQPDSLGGKLFDDPADY